MERYKLSTSEQEIFDEMEDVNYHSEALVHLAKIVKDKFPIEDDRNKILVQAEAIKKLHDDIGFMPYELMVYRVHLHEKVREYIIF